MLCRLIAETAALFGGCLLVDCHSMPSAAALCGRETADIVLGDCHGTACGRGILDAARGFFTERGLKVAINAPYAGGFTTGHYGQPRRHRHALQIEINRALYMDERSFERKPGFANFAADLAEFVERLGAAVAACLPERDRRIEPRRRRAHF
jgi:N-formylglutamate amidohydrolase